MEGRFVKRFRDIVSIFIILVLSLSVCVGAKLDEKAILELGKDPGFNIRKLHKQGITGEGVGIAIIDTYLLPEHVEYKDQLKKYIDLGGYHEEKPALHGTAIASIAVGKTVGVAPGADLYFLQDGSNPDSNEMGVYVYKAVKEVVKINKQLPKENRIRVISYSGTVASIYPDYKSYCDALELAKKEGIFFVSCSMKKDGFYHSGLERKPESDPNNYLSYKPFSWKRYIVMDSYLERKKIYPNGEVLLAPYDGRTTADQENNKDYSFFKTGCPSWEVPYIAGLYVLACQVNPDVTPELFWGKALETGYSVKIAADQGKSFTGKIINPTKLYKELGKIKK
jgi:hypothetical protein